MDITQEDEKTVSNTWLADMKQSFYEAIEIRDWETAQGIVEDVKDKFHNEGWTLDKELQDARGSYADVQADAAIEEQKEHEVE